MSRGFRILLAPPSWRMTKAIVFSPASDLLTLPPATVMLAALKLPDGSESVKVRVAVWPEPTLLTLLLMLTLGVRVSKLSVGVVPAPPLLPAVSV